MSKLYFKYGTMASGKTLDLIRTYDTYTRQGKKVLVLSPSVDTRHGVSTIRSRLGMEIQAQVVEVGKLEEFILKNPLTITKGYDVVILDEAQFFKSNDIEALKLISRSNTPVIAYGLKVDFKGHLFEGSKALIELAESLDEIKSVCTYCNNKATHNIRLVNGKATTKGDIIQVGDEEYLPTCHDCFYRLTFLSK